MEVNEGLSCSRLPRKRYRNLVVGSYKLRRFCCVDAKAEDLSDQYGGRLPAFGSTYIKQNPNNLKENSSSNETNVDKSNGNDIATGLMS